MSPSAVRPLFIFSITRSGSTLVQRVLGSYDEIATVSEPWLLIPLLYTLRGRGVASEYSHHMAVQAIEDFSRELPNGPEDYRRELHDFVLRLYQKASDGKARYFLDKTPPYFFVAEDVMRVFPEGKFIFLWRNPLSIVASLIHFRNGEWDPTAFRTNLFNGVASLVAAYQRNHTRVCAVRFEDLVTGDGARWRDIMSYLGVEFDPASLTRFSDVSLAGRMGDPHGTKRYSALSTEPLTKWRAAVKNPIRKAWCRRYLTWIGHERLAVMGYELDALLGELDAVPSGLADLGGDCRQVARALLKEPLRVKARRSVGLGGPSSLRYILEP